MFKINNRTVQKKRRREKWSRKNNRSVPNKNRTAGKFGQKK